MRRIRILTTETVRALRASRFFRCGLRRACGRERFPRQGRRWLVACVAAVFVGIAGRPAPAVERIEPGYRTRRTVLHDVTVVVGPGKRLAHRSVVIERGTITAIGPVTDVPADARAVRGPKLWVYPGFIDAGNEALLSEVKVEPASGRPVSFGEYALAESRWDNRKGLTPEFTLEQVAALPEQKLEELRRAGFVAAHALPRGRIASGFSGLVSTRSLPLREAIIVDRVFGVFELKALGGGTYPQTLMGAMARLRQAFLDARFWERMRSQPEPVRLAEGWPRAEPTLDAVLEILHGRRRPLFLTSSRDDVFRALQFADELGLKSPVLQNDGAIADAIEDLRRLQRFSKLPPVILRLDFPSAPKIEKPTVQAATALDGHDASLRATSAPASQAVGRVSRTGPNDERPSGNSPALQAEQPAPLRVQQDALQRWKQRVAVAKALAEAGVPVAFATGGLTKSSEILAKVRELVKQGVPADVVLAGLTTDAARVLGAEHFLGRVQRGRPAYLTVFDGPFEKSGSKLRFVVIGDAVFEFNKPAESKPPGKDNRSGNAAGSASDAPVASERTASRTTSAPAPGRPNASAKTPGPVALSGRLESPGTPGRAEHDAGAASRAGEATSGDAASGTSPDAQPTELPQDRLHPRPRTGGNVFVRAGTVWTGTGRTLNDAGILIRNGKIVAIGRGLKPPADVTVIDARNRFVMPGIIDTHSHIMITGGVNEATQSIVCECRIADVVNSQDVSEFRALAGGVTTARLLHGSANTIGGQDAVVKLKHGRTAAEHLMSDQSNGVKFALGENVKYRRNRFPNTRLGVAALLQRAFAEAERYREQRDAARRDPRRLFRRDLRLDVLADILEHRKWIHSHCYRADEILMLLRTAESLGIRVQSLQHVLEGYKVAPEIAAHGASCSTFADWWAYKVEAYDAIPHNAALLHEAGVNAVIKSDDAELIRHLYQEAAKTVRYGCMPLEAALRTITVNPARELRLLHRIGTLEVGKDGDLAIFNGHPLDAFARCETTVIEGEVYFNRSEHPTAMTAAMKKRSSEPRTWRPAEPNRDRIEQLSERLAAQAAGRSFALVGATVHPVEQPDIDDGVVIVRDGRIEAVGRRGEIPIPGGTRIVDVRGLHVFPGIIDAGTTLGLTEIGKVVETHDYDESGPFQPDLIAATGVNRDSELIPVARAGGITTFLTRPTTGLISGRASVMQTHGWTSEEMTIRRVAGLWMRWPRGSDSDKRIEQLEEFFAEARRYDAARTRAERGDGKTGAVGGSPGAGSGDRPSADERRGGHVVRDPRFEAMRPFVRGEARVFVEADGRNQIAQAVLFAERHGLRIVVCGGTDAWKLADVLRVREIPVIVGPVMRRPVEDYDPSDAPYANPGRLHEAGVAFCIRSDSASNSRNAPFEAAMAVAFGLPEAAAVRAVTLSPAEILGIADATGSIVPGKRGDLVVTDGSILQPASHVLMTVVDGVAYAPESRQTRFYRRYRRRILEWKADSSR